MYQDSTRPILMCVETEKHGGYEGDGLRNT
jgi:hypothetical protein